MKKLILLTFLTLAACGGGEAGSSEAELRRSADDEPIAGELRDPSTGQSQNTEPDAQDMDAPVSNRTPDDGALSGTSTPSADRAQSSTAQNDGSGAPRGQTSASNPTSSSASQPGDPEAVDVLRRAERTYAELRSLEADFTQEVTVPLVGSSQTSAGKIYHRKPDRFMMRFSDPAGDIVVADGEHLWMYYPSIDDEQVMRTSLGSGQEVDLQRELLSNAAERFDVRAFEEANVAGRAAWRLSLVPRERAPYRSVDVWVDRQDYLVRRFEVVEENESVRRLELRNLRPNVALSDDLFSSTPPAGAKVFDQ